MSWIEQKLQDPEFAVAYAEEAFVEEVINELITWMDQQRVTRAELALRLGLSRPSVTNFLKRKNTTLRTVARVAYLLDAQPHFTVRAKPTCQRLSPEEWEAPRRDWEYELKGVLAEAAAA